MLVKLIESSPDTPEGSISKDLNLSKMWIFHKLKELDMDNFDNVYILGSWYGSISFFLMASSVKFKHCYCIDIDSEKVEQSMHYLKRMKMLDQFTPVKADANKIKFTGDRALIINTSTNDIEGTNWLKHIEPGTACVFQGKDHQEFSNGIDTLQKFDRAYPLSKTEFIGHLALDDTHGDPYLRFMKIGYK